MPATGEITMRHLKIAEAAFYFVASILGGFVACEVYAQVTHINTYAETVAALVM